LKEPKIEKLCSIKKVKKFYNRYINEIHLNVWDNTIICIYPNVPDKETGQKIPPQNWRGFFYLAFYFK